MPAEELARLCHEAGVLYRTTPRNVEAVLKRRPASPGIAKLRAVMSGDVPALLSKLEKGALRLYRAAGFPRPDEINRSVNGRRVDFRWLKQRLTVELDSFQYHNSRYSWEQDRRREREARARGDEFRRYTWGDVFEDSGFLLAEMRELLFSPKPGRMRA